MTPARDCTVCLLTPPGRSAVAVLLVDGSGAVERVGSLFQAVSSQPLAETRLDRIVVGRFATDEHDCGEEVVVCRRGPEQVEVHCHGGQAAAGRVVESLVAAGCREVDWESRVDDLEVDAISAEARSGLAHARTERTVAILLDQYNGALRVAQDSIVAQLRNGQTHEAAATLRRLMARAPVGLHLTDPWRVVIAGPPNVGKSSLINALLGYQRAIVYEQPGTTRDAVTALTAIDGWPVELIDTAGLRTSDDEIEQAGVELARGQIARADLVVFVTDASQVWDYPTDDPLPAADTALLVHNKSDLRPPAADRPSGLATSALTGRGIDQLVAVIGQRLVPQPPPDYAAVPFTARQTQLLEQALAAIDGGEIRQAVALLESNTLYY